MYSSAFGGVHWDSCDCKSLNVLNASSAFTDLTLVVGGLWGARVLRRLLWSLLKEKNWEKFKLAGMMPAKTRKT